VFKDLRGDILGSVSVVVSRENRAAYLFLWRFSTETRKVRRNEFLGHGIRKNGELSVWAFEEFVHVPGFVVVDLAA